MPLTFIREDITRLDVDAIVNAANSSLAPGGGVCGAIFSAAGREDMHAACRAIGHCAVGHAVITPGFHLRARYVIHAVGPIWKGGLLGERRQLASCYTSALRIAKAHGLSSIAFPLISSGIYGYPKREALQIAISSIRRFLNEEEDLDVTLVLFDRSAVALGRDRHLAIREYINDHYADAFARRRRQREETSFSIQEDEQTLCPIPESCCMPPKTAPQIEPRTLNEVVRHLDDTFSQMLLRLIDERGMKDTEVYKRANIDRKLFSKVRKSGYTPSKQTALALCIALRLSLDESRDLLARAGYALSPSSLSDIIIRFHIEHGVYDIDEINAALFEYGQTTLGA